jgi:Xaa-Pro aminopeptidase
MMLKAVKNSIEIQGMRRAHVRDGTAMCEFMAYFEDKVIFCYYFLIYFANHVLHFRCLRVRSGLNSRWRIPWTVSGTTSSLSQGASFKTIVGFGANGAKPHYRPRQNASLIVGKNATVVIDSGGQYLGT